MDPSVAICNGKDCLGNITKFDSIFTGGIGCVPIPSYPLSDRGWDEQFNKSLNISFQIPKCEIKNAELEILANCSLQISLYTTGEYGERIDLPYIDCESLYALRKKNLNVKEFLTPESSFFIIIKPNQRGTCFKFDYAKLLLNCTY